METTVCLHLAKVLCLLNKAASFSCYLAKLKIKTDKTNWDKCEMITFPRLHVKLYIPSNIKTILMLWHTKTKEKDTLAKLQKFSALPKGPNQPRDGKSTRCISCSRHRNIQIYKFRIPNILFTSLIEQ